MAWSHVACCVDRDGRAEPIIAVASRVAREADARLTLVHGAPRAILEAQVGERWSPTPEDPSRRAARWLAELAEREGCEHALLTGTTPASVCAWAEQAGPDLIVVGASRGPLTRLASGGFAAHLAYHAPCHVLVVRPLPAEEEDR